MTRSPSAVVQVLVLGVAMVLAGVAGWGLGRSTVPTCTELRDAHREAGLEIAARAQVDVSTIEPEPVERAYDAVQGRPDCFSSFERQEAANLYRLHGPDR